MWNPLQSLHGLLSRKDRNLLTQLEQKAASEGKTAFGKLTELVSDYVSGSTPRAVSVKSGVVPVGVASLSSLQAELEKTKATLEAAFELSDMLRPAEREPNVLNDLLVSYVQGQAQAKAEQEQVITQNLSKPKVVG